MQPAKEQVIVKTSCGDYKTISKVYGGSLDRLALIRRQTVMPLVITTLWMVSEDH